MGCFLQWITFTVFAILITVPVLHGTKADTDTSETSETNRGPTQNGEDETNISGHQNELGQNRSSAASSTEANLSEESVTNVTDDPDIGRAIQGLKRWCLDISVISSRHHVLVKVDNRVIFNVSSAGKSKAEEMSSAGLYFVVLNQHDGRTIMTRIFDMHEYGRSIGVPSLLNSISKGRILIFAVKTEASLNMPMIVRKLLKDLGAETGYRLPFRGFWAWVVTAQGPSWGESVIYESADLQDFYTSPVHLSVAVPLDTSGTCWDASQPRERKRERFCRQYDGYGNLCSCDNPVPLVFQKQELENSIIDDVPVAILANKRPQALYSCFMTVLNQKGGSLERLIVLLDGRDKEVLNLLDLFDINYLVNDMENVEFAGAGARISYHYRFSLHAVFSTFPNASKAIILEEDLLAAPDFFSYFNQTSWLLDVDRSLYCVSAWNDLGALHIAHHPHRLYRVETHAGYGWMLTRNFFNEIYPIWKDTNSEHDWDVWFRSAEIRGGRECVVPDVSRTFHNSVSGTHIKTILAQAHFVGHPVTSQRDIKLHNVDRMTQEKYEEDLYAILESDNVYFLNTTLHPCNKFFLPRNFTAGPVVIFMTMDNHDMNEGWKHLASCLGAWHIDTRSHHRGLIRFNFYDTELFIIGYPFSDYSYLKPSWVRVTPEAGGNESIFTRRAMMNRLRFRRPELEEFSPFLMKQRSTPEPIFKNFIYPQAQQEALDGKAS